VFEDVFQSKLVDMLNSLVRETDANSVSDAFS